MGYGTCPVCGHQLYWQSDFSYQDYGLDGEGIVSNWKCSNENCNASIECYVDCNENTQGENEGEHD